MIRAVVDFALRNRLLVLAVGLMLLVWGGIAFHNLPIEAYPDVANNYVQIITQWPGRAAEEIEQQVTIPIEIVMAGIPHLEHLRSVSLFGLSSVMLIFDDESNNDWNREKTLERLSQVTLPAGLQPQMGTDWSPVGQIFWYTLESTNPEYDLMEQKSIEDWVLEPKFKSVPNVVDVSSFGGPTREYQVRIDPNKLIDYGLSISQVEQALANNNVNSGGSFIQEGGQQINIREVGLIDHTQDIGEIVLKTQNGTPIRVRDVAVVEQGPKIRLGQIGKSIHLPNGKIIDYPDVVEGVLLVSIILFFFLGNVRGALIVALTIPFALLFASICLHLEHVPANLLSLGALDFGMVVDGAVVMVENIVRHMGKRGAADRTILETIREAAHEVQRPVFYAIAIIITAYLPIFTLQSVEGRLFRPMALTVAFALLGALLFSMLIAPVLSSI